MSRLGRWPWIAVAVVGGLAGFGHPANAGETPRPLTLDEALREAVAQNGELAQVGYARDQAEASIVSARGAFDPLYRAELTGLTQRERLYDQGVPVGDLTTRAWSLDQTIGGELPTGTSFSADFGVSRDVATALVRQGPLAGEALSDVSQASLGLSVGQALLRGARMRYNLQNVTLATDGLTSAELSVQKQRQDTLLAVASAYWAWSYAVQAQAIATDATAVAQEALRVGDVQVERGQLAPVEGTRLEAALVQARQDELDAGVTAESAANTLLTLIGEDPGTPVLPATLPGDVPDLALDPALVAEVARAQNLDLALARQDLESARHARDAAKDGVLPSLQAVGSAGVAAQRCPQASDDKGCVKGNGLDAIGGLGGRGSFPVLTVAGVFDVPLGNRAARGNRDIAEVEVQKAERVVADLERSVSAQVEDAVRALQASRARMDLSDANQRLAEATLEAEEALAAAGRTIQKNVLEARTEVARTRNEAARARTDYRLAQASLLALQGQLTEDSD